MKKVSIIIVTLIVISIPLQTSCAQTSPCPINNKKAEKALKKYLTIERNIQNLRDGLGLSISNNAKNNIKSLSGNKSKKECQQLRSNLEWLEKASNYSIYKVADLYFIIIYSFNKNGLFRLDEIHIVDSEYKFLGSIIDFDVSE